MHRASQTTGADLPSENCRTEGRAKIRKSLGIVLGAHFGHLQLSTTRTEGSWHPEVGNAEIQNSEVDFPKNDY
jgi:hypothetical protein